ncbi:MAG: Hydrogenase-4 component B / Formate hydrogenlyase subunit 3 [uncultured Thiotrichaceae bacterium]|uniref:Hydrogenase-4 component B / Formate hydrogenlyase subunit 3 n=1 Tax=uncultured Thiotrichaceae bacterium TaxID=298394 RepID=A0A6S6T2H9_9GAMM|nr:MAG: Hydrogenase-4 component B / Formate hydrogenlyase subunit 3 [uncultured Thiotrichaceae bacterium]
MMINDAIVWLIAIPLLASLLSLVFPKKGTAIAIAGSILGLLASVALVYQVYQSGPITHELGGWKDGLGIVLRVDAMSALFIVMTMLVVTMVGFYASAYFTDAHKKAQFWPLWLMMVVALIALLASGDLFNLYVTLELLGLSAVGLTALSDNRAAVQAAIRYLGIGLLGSLVFLMGVALIYTAYGVLDLAMLATVVEAEPAAQLALALMTAGLLIKSALFPMHFWLPAAHANAPAPVSAALSALVVKVSVYLIIRLWFDVFSPVLQPTASFMLGVLGALAVVWGSWQALRAERLKLMAAYSTVAQLGYLFIFIPLVMAFPVGEERNTALAAFLLLALTHAFAKSALFLSSGVVLQRAGHDRIAELGGTARALPLTIFVIALAGVALIGLPPSGSFLGKWYLISSAVQTGQWWWIVVIAMGSLLAAGYMFRILGHAFGPDESIGKVMAKGSEEIPALILALTATVVLGFGSAWMWDFVNLASPLAGN